MNIDFNFTQINRAIMHHILGKGQDGNVRCEYSNSLIPIGNDVRKILIDRLRSSFGMQSRSFELTLKNDADGSVFFYLNDLSQTEDGEFIERSKAIANLLADNSNRGSIPGGFLLVLDCTYQEQNLYILIKAEPHSALNIANWQAHALNDIILSPSQKLYKSFLMLKERSGNTKDDFSYMLFDDQFTNGSSLARYFYSDFLGLSIEGNSYVLTKMFYENMLKLIKKIYEKEYDQKAHIENLLQSSLNNERVTISPRDIVNDIIPLDKRDDFLNKICVNEFSRSFPKNISGLSTVLRKKNVEICNGLKLVGNSTLFTDRITIEDALDRPGVKIITVDTNE